MFVCLFVYLVRTMRITLFIGYECLLTDIIATNTFLLICLKNKMFSLNSFLEMKDESANSCVLVQEVTADCWAGNFHFV